jgi:hypothetical protein
MFDAVLKYAAAISAIAAAVALLVTIIRTYIEPTKKNCLKRFERNTAISPPWFEDKNIQAIIIFFQIYV